MATSHTCWSLSSGCVGQCTLYTCRVLLSAPNKPYDFCGRKALGKESLVKQEKQKQNTTTTTTKTCRVQNRMKTTTKQKQNKKSNRPNTPHTPTPNRQTNNETTKSEDPGNSGRNVAVGMFKMYAVCIKTMKLR